MLRSVLAAAMLVGLCSTAEAVSISTVDVISSPDYFNGFEGLPASTAYGATYTEGGITVTQINGDLNGIWTFFNPGEREGSRSWYPNGNDRGYTQIQLESGAEFTNLGFLAGSGFSNPTYLAYSLYSGGVEVAAGLLAHTRPFTYLSFLGGGFDTVYLRDTISTSLSTTVFSGGVNALALDSIEATAVVPIPAALPLFASALAGFGLLRLFRRKAAPAI